MKKYDVMKILSKVNSSHTLFSSKDSVIQEYLFNNGASPCGAMAKVLNCDLEVNEFELQSTLLHSFSD